MAPQTDPPRRANDLEGAEWTRSSISVWSDIRKTAEEQALKHPALFPQMLVRRVIRCFTRERSRVVLEPFCGSGSTLVAAEAEGGRGIGFEVSEPYLELTRQRMAGKQGWELYPESARRIPEVLAPGIVDLCVTSPPYWDILSQKRTADYKDVRDYAGADEDLSRIGDYEGFIEELGSVFDGVWEVLRPGGYCVVNVMDLRKKSRFFPFHSDLAARLSDPERGGRFEYDDLIIWDRRGDYNFLRPLGYPAVFRVNKVHEFLLIFRKL
jgi:DNA modification methylase